MRLFAIISDRMVVSSGRGKTVCRISYQFPSLKSRRPSDFMAPGKSCGPSNSGKQRISVHGNTVEMEIRNSCEKSEGEDGRVFDMHGTRRYVSFFSIEIREISTA